MQLDTLTISERLHKAGLPQKVAKEWAGIWHEDVTSRLATKEDIQGVRNDMESMEASLRKDMKSMEERIDQRLATMEVRLENRMLRHTYSAVGVLGLLMIVLRFIDPLKTLVSG